MKPSSRVSSWCLLAGVLVGFAGAVWQGHQAAGYSKPARFQRFHQRISPDALFYPPYSMLETLALARWEPGRILVLLGGNSIFNGVGQPENELWSRRLQELLGPDFVVVNLAFRGSFPAHGAALVAESLLRRGYPVIYVANTHPHAGAGHAALGHYGYLYWQARAAGKLTEHPARDRAIASWEAGLAPADRAQLEETRLAARFEPIFRAQALWHHVSYRHLTTVWTDLLHRDSWRRRDIFPDNEPPALPVEHRFQIPPGPELQLLRTFSELVVQPAADGGWEWRPGERARQAEEIDAAFPAALRPRMLLVLDHYASHYRARLTPEERARQQASYAAAAEVWAAQGIACRVVGEDFTDEDYIDRVHLSGAGGAKLAAELAPHIRRLAQTPLP